MRSTLWLLTLMLLTASSMRSWADPQPQIQRTRLEKGKAAPFAGVLLSDAALAKIMTGYEQQIAKLKVELVMKDKETTANKTADDAVCKARVTEQTAKLAACHADLKRQQVIYTKALDGKECPHPAWTYLSFVGGAVFGGVISVVAQRTDQ